MTATKTNPGPGTSVCPNCGDVWLVGCRHVTDNDVTTASADYDEIIARCCVICGAILEKGIAWK
jgi:hypothetical protein